MCANTCDVISKKSFKEIKIDEMVPRPSKVQTEKNEDIPSERKNFGFKIKPLLFQSRDCRLLDS